jgi:hypothetical protein
MHAIRATVRKGRLRVDQPTRFPEGTVIQLIVAEPGDELDAAERRALHAALAASWREARAGRVAPAKRLLRKLASRR